MKPKIKPVKEIKWKFGVIGWLTCPHCKKLIFASDKEVINTLKKWKKQK